MLRLVYQRCAGLDVHKKTVVACRVRINEQGEWEQEVRTFGTMTCELLLLLDWLLAWGVTQVVMESTGEYWKPVYNLLEGHVEVLLVNAQHVKQVPGRKTDVQDAQWLAELLAHGLLKASFIPAKPQRNLRDLTRYRVKLVEEPARVRRTLLPTNPPYPLLTGYFAPLASPEFFAKVIIDHGALCWPGGLDLDPVVVHAWAMGLPLALAGEAQFA
jgi:hypothetical protein